MSDGAQVGVNAADALKVILGGEDEADQPHVTTQELAERVLSTTIDQADRATGGTYEGCADWVARQIVEMALRDPMVMAPNGDLYASLKVVQCPEGSREREVLTSITGFQWGWAENAARAILELSAVPNPALLTVKPKVAEAGSPLGEVAEGAAESFIELGALLTTEDDDG